MDHKSIWMDEAASLEYSRSPWKALSDQGQPPLYYLLLFLVTHIGTSESILRISSVLFSVAQIVLLYRIASRFFGVREAILSSFLLSVSMFDISLSQEARMYPMFSFLALLSLFYFHEAISQKKWKFWIALSVINVLGLYTHYYMVFVVAVEVAFLATKFGNEALTVHNLDIEMLKKSSLSIAFSALIYVPWLVTTWEYSRPWTWIPQPTIQNLVRIIWSFSGVSRIENYLFLSLATIGLLYSKRTGYSERYLLLLWIALPFIMAYLVSIIYQPIIQGRYFILVLPIYLLLVSRGIVCISNLVAKFLPHRLHFPRRLGPVPYWPSAVLSIVVISTIAFTYQPLHIASLISYYDNVGEEDFRGVAQYLTIHSNPGDLILILPGYAAHPFLYYFKLDYITIEPFNGSVEEYIQGQESTWIVVVRGHIKNASNELALANYADQKLDFVKEFNGHIHLYHSP